MATVSRDAWKCVVCGHEWLKGQVVPTHCAALACRSRRWNAATGNKTSPVRTIELNREEGTDTYEVLYLLNDDIQGVLEYPHAGHWSRMQDEIDSWIKEGVRQFAQRSGS